MIAVPASALVLIAAVGLAAGAVAPPRPAPRRPWRSADHARRRLMAAASAVAVVIVLGVMPSVLLGALAVIGTWWRRRRAAAAATQAAESAVAELIDLVALALRGGVGPLAVLADVEADVPAPIDRAVSQVVASVNGGITIGRALGPLRSAGGRRADDLCDLLVRGVDDGVGVAEPALALARRARDDEYRRIDARARRLPVLLLAPSFVCLVPAFLLLVVVPMFVVGLRAVSTF